MAGGEGGNFRSPGFRTSTAAGLPGRLAGLSASLTCRYQRTSNWQAMHGYQWINFSHKNTNMYIHIMFLILGLICCNRYISPSEVWAPARVLCRQRNQEVYRPESRLRPLTYADLVFPYQRPLPISKPLVVKPRPLLLCR